MLLVQSSYTQSYAQKTNKKSKNEYNPEFKYAPPQLKNDFLIYKTAVEQAHPGLYLYQSKEQWKAQCDMVLSQLNDSLTEQQFFRLLLPLTAAIKERHSGIEYSKNAYFYQNKKEKFLPFTVKTLTDSLNPAIRRVFIDYCADSNLKRGTELLAVNGQNVQQILKTMLVCIPTDGHILSSKYRDLERKFSSTHFALYGGKDTYQLQIRPAQQTLTYPQLTPGLSRDSIRNVFKKIYPEVEKESPLQLKILDQDSFAYLSVHTFSHTQLRSHKVRYKRYLKNAFRTIQKSGVKNLVLDLRKNLGGRLGYEARLFSYLSDTSVDYIHHTRQTTKLVKINGYTKRPIRRRIMPFLEAMLIYKRQTDGTFAGSGAVYRTPRPSKYRFQSTTYILISGQTGSAAAFLCSALKEFSNNVLFIGEEAGGCYNGFSAGRYWKLQLPKTGIVATIPLIRFITNVRQDTQGHGLVPDYYALPLVEDYEQKKTPSPNYLRALTKTARQ